MINLPDNVLCQIFYYCNAETMAKCYFVSRRFHFESKVAIAHINKYVMEKYYSKEIFRSPYFMRPNELLLFNNLTAKRVFVVRGFITYVLNMKNGVWKRCADTRRDRGYFAAIWFRGEIFAIGTYSVIAAGTVEKYNPFANCWSPGPSLPLKLRSACAAVLGDKLYVLGGHDAFSENYSDTVFIYDDGVQTPKSDAVYSCDGNTEGYWILSGTRLLRARSRHAAVGFEGRIWIAGGCFENNTVVTKSVEIFDPTIGKWMKGPSLTTRRDFSNLLVVLGRLYAVGGDVDDEGLQAIRTIEVFDKCMNSWRIITAFKDERRGFSTSSIGSKIYIFGGSSDEHYELNTWDAYDVTDGQWDSDLYNKYEKMPLIDCWGQAVTFPPEDLVW
jgi:Kelch motif